jgi:hypothetical protein
MIEFESKMIDEESFALNYADATGYYHRALQFQANEQRPSLVFNIAAVALERYLVALCDLYGEDPRNHNYITLMRAVETFMHIPKDLNKRIKAMDWIFGICSIDEHERGQRIRQGKSPELFRVELSTVVVSYHTADHNQDPC